MQENVHQLRPLHADGLKGDLGEEFGSALSGGEDPLNVENSQQQVDRLDEFRATLNSLFGGKLPGQLRRVGKMGHETSRKCHYFSPNNLPEYEE